MFTEAYRSLLDQSGLSSNALAALQNASMPISRLGWFASHPSSDGTQISPNRITLSKPSPNHSRFHWLTKLVLLQKKVPGFYHQKQLYLAPYPGYHRKSGVKTRRSQDSARQRRDKCSRSDTEVFWTSPDSLPKRWLHCRSLAHLYLSWRDLHAIQATMSANPAKSDSTV